MMHSNQENFALLVLQKAMVAFNQGLPSIDNALKDMVLEKMFNLCSASSENGVKVMYKCCQSMVQIDKRTAYVKQFFDKVVGTGHITCLKTLVFNEESDITRVIQNTKMKIEIAMQQRVQSQKRPMSPNAFLNSVSEKFWQQGIKEEIKLQLNVLAIISQLYNMNDVSSKMLWEVKGHLDSDLKCIEDLVTRFEEDMDDMQPSLLDDTELLLVDLEREHLEILQQVLSIIRSSMSAMGPSFAFYELHSTNKAQVKR